MHTSVYWNKASIRLSLLVPLISLAFPACKQRNFGSVPSSDYSSKLVDQLPASGNWDDVYRERNSAYVSYVTNVTDKEQAKRIDWFMHKPLGVNGIPYLAFRVFVEMYPEIWTENGSIYDKLGFPPWPSDYNGDALKDWSQELKGANQRSPLPYGFVTWKDFTTDANSITGSENVFFSCAACHTGRVAKEGRVRYYPGGAASQAEAQLFANLLYQTVAKFTNVEQLAAGKISADQVKPSNPRHFVELLRFFTKTRNYCNNIGANKPFKVDQVDRDDFGKGECEEQRNLLLAGISPNANDADLKSSLRNETYNETPEASNNRNPSLLKIASKLRSPDANFKKLLKNVIGSGVKTAIMYHNVGAKLSFAPRGTQLTGNVRNSELDKVRQSTLEKVAPPLFAPRPGQMDAFGLVQGIVYLNASRPDLLMWKYFPSSEAAKFSGAYVQGFADTDEYRTSKEFAQDQSTQEKMRGTPGKFDGEVHKNFSQYASQAAALSDIKSLFRSSEEIHANWDGNQGEGARVLASGVSSVGDPTKVFTEIHETQNAFIDALPSPPYAFGDQEPDGFYQRALRGQALFNKSCASCHHRKNEAIYNIGTDPNRAHVVYSPFMRMALSALTQAACDIGKQRELQREQNNQPRLDGRAPGNSSQYWCELQPNGKPYATYAALYDDLMRPYRGESAGYKADPLYGIWLDAPYLHNGSVPTLRDLFKPTQQRPKKFIRGNPNYNMKDGGFESSPSAALKRSNEDKVPLPAGTVQNSDVFHTAEFDTSLRGNSNAGHEFWHDEYSFDQQTGQWKGGGREWTPEEIDDVIDYLKTL